MIHPQAAAQFEVHSDYSGSGTRLVGSGSNIHSLSQPATSRRSLMRKYDVSCLAPNGDPREFSQVAPANVVFENAFAAIARGTLVSTEKGPVAVEDLLPGARVMTDQNGAQDLLWKGSTMLISSAAGQSDDMRYLTRIAADSFGLGRPMPDLMLGPKARLKFRHLDFGDALAPVQEFHNDETVVSISPRTPVQVFHLAFAAHQIISANGLNIESYHPGKINSMSFGSGLAPLFLGLFPHIQKFEDFGPVCLTRRDITATASNNNWMA